MAISTRQLAIIQVITQRLAADTRLAGLPIYADVVDGQIVIRGTCDSEEQRHIIRELVQGIAGVKCVEHIRVRPLSQAL